MKFIFGIILLSVSVFAQDAPKKPELPEKVELTVEQTKQVKDAQGRLETATLRADKLALQIQIAQEDLKKLQEAAQKEQQGFATFFAGLVKIPSDKLIGYTIEEKDGQIILTKKKE